MKVYVNHPNPHFTIHHRNSCSEYRKRRKANQRELRVRSGSLLQDLQQFSDPALRFGATRTMNDLWIDIELLTPQHDYGCVYVIHELLGSRFAPFRRASVVYHRCTR